MRQREGSSVPALRSVPAPTVDAEDQGTRSALPRAPARAARRVRPAEEAWSKIASPLAEQLGIRVLFFGVTGSGKTTGIKDLLRYITGRNLVDLVLVHDVKKPEPQYEGTIAHDARHVLANPPEEYPATIVLRKLDLDHTPSVETAARVTMQAGYNDIPTLLVVDEFQRGLTDGGKFESQSLRRIFCEGLGLHASVIAGKQLPQFTPTEARGQAAKVFFRTTRDGLNFLEDERFVGPDQAAAIATLQTGEFTFTPDEGDFDGFIYRVPAP